MDVVVLGNFDIFPRTIDPDFTVTGSWYEFFSGAVKTVSAENQNTAVSLQPGEYRIYTSKQVERPSFLTDIEDLPGIEKPEAAHFEIYPNPFADIVRIKFNENYVPGPHRIELFSADGTGIRAVEVPEGINELTLEGSSLPGGMYFVRVTSGRLSAVKKVIRY